MGWLRDLFGRGAGEAAAAAPPPGNAQAAAWRQKGNDALAAGNLAEAASCYEKGLDADPLDAALRLNHGFVLLQQGRFEEAAERLRQALAFRKPGDGCEPHDAFYLLARAQIGLGDQPAALASLEAATRERPDFAEALEEGARILHVLERHEQAADWLRRLLALVPTHFNRILLAHELRACGGDAEVVDLLRPVCDEEPGNVDASVLLYAALMKMRRYEDALAEADRALGLHGARARFLVNRSVALERLDRLDEALACVDQALALEPARRDAMVNRCTILTNLLRTREALDAADAGLKLHPDDPDLHWSRAIALLTLGELRQGFAEAEWRARCTHFRGKLLELDEPRWQGESLQGRSIFLYGEQGFGDNVQFVRYVPVVAAMARQVYVLVSEALEPLVRRTLPANCELLPQNSKLPHVDFQCPLMSVPAVLGQGEDSIPAAMPYLRPNPELAPSWRARLGTGAVNVGIAWAGNPRHTNDRNRSMPLASMRGIDQDGFRFFTVQPDVRDADRLALQDWPRAADIGRDLRHFDDTAALLDALDLVLTVDTSTAHLAGALGKPVWILLPYVPDWRWQVERSDSPWYPSARIYRQPAPGAWAAVLERVRGDLAAWAKARA